jgi:hypothetical protein
MSRVGGNALGRLIGAHRSISRLDVSNGGIPQECAACIVEGLNANKTLKVVKMQWNPLCSGVPLIKQALQDMESKPRFSLDNCYFDLLTEVCMMYVSTVSANFDLPHRCLIHNDLHTDINAYMHTPIEC